jgi:hypothetical protein
MPQKPATTLDSLFRPSSVTSAVLCAKLPSIAVAFSPHAVTQTLDPLFRPSSVTSAVLCAKLPSIAVAFSRTRLHNPRFSLRPSFSHLCSRPCETAFPRRCLFAARGYTTLDSLFGPLSVTSAILCAKLRSFAVAFSPRAGLLINFGGEYLKGNIGSPRRRLSRLGQNRLVLSPSPGILIR